MVSGIITGDAPVSYWSIFSLSLVTVPEVFAKVNSPQFPSFSKMGNLETSARRPNTQEIQESIKREYLWGKFEEIKMDRVKVNWNKVCLFFCLKVWLKELVINDKISTKISMIMRKCLLLSIKSPFSRKATSSCISWFWIVTNYFSMLCFFLFRRQLDYQDVLDNLKSKGISIRVASPKLVMEEVRFSHIWGFQGQYPFALFCKVFSLIVADHFCLVLTNLCGFLLPLLPPFCHVWVCR